MNVCNKIYTVGFEFGITTPIGAITACSQTHHRRFSNLITTGFDPVGLGSTVMGWATNVFTTGSDLC